MHIEDLLNKIFVNHKFGMSNCLQIVSTQIRAKI